MPIAYLSALTAPERSARANQHLGITLAFTAGALNAGGFLTIGQYTSHMTGMVSAAADNLALGQIGLVLAALLSIAAFVGGAATTALLVNWGRRGARRHVYLPPLLTEAVLLLVFGAVGARLSPHEIVSVSLGAILLCFVMGLQNALITKISNAEIRTTHVTGLVTDIGIELGKLLYWNRDGGAPDRPAVQANRRRLRLHGLLVGAFFVGGVTGALAFKHVGFGAVIPLALTLVLMSMAPALAAPRRV
ncbi:YoaK family protein [Derxia gummosa]|uniref:YoaK family protein n=1 Tax=Derxia gummosa DSM 723 TaxID=1121388 RepID=A0A8B6X2N5_9BURK|nr:YoaK family protein [Derxia gummosa]